jgi:indole-3-glycerol phosphate synthase
LTTVLDRILADKRHEVEQCKTAVPLEEMRRRIVGLPKCRNFYSAMTQRNQRGLNIIAEVKKASPSAGVIREDFDPAAIARTYERCGADAISVLTDAKYFQGRLEYVAMVKEAVGLPILRKDFILDEYQVYEARAAGADAILLIAEALPAGQLMDLLILANQLTLTVLLEVHGADSLMRMRSLVGFPQRPYSLLGINTGRLLSLVDDPGQVITESGIRTRQDVDKIRQWGVGGVLIGQALCESGDIEGKFTELFD